MINLPPEKLGSFYLGARYDMGTKAILNDVVNYDARDLTTHAVCVGMTGSGKTGLCIGLLEEAAIDKVPAIIIDPKGDMTNLLLQFENINASEFEPWINADDAGRKGMTVGDYAKATADKWKNGLADWGQDSDRVKRLKDSVDYCIYTPGSDSGVPINIMGSFAAPGIDFDSDSEMLRERIQGMVAALLGMIGSKEDPVRSREGILLANLFEHYWRKNEDLDLGLLIRSVQKPPIQQLGVFDIDTFFPEKDRFDLAMDFNALIASPQFKYWLQGEPLDIEKIYFTKDGKPRHSIFYIAHLSDSERMFFVTLLLNSLIGWMRRQSGTTSLRSLLYFDEIFGYFPPTAEPPSKKPLLTILKQARAYGVGAVLVTQNPVDIDYKGLSNAGTWFIGKLQTERDKKRVLEGLEGAIAEAGTGSENDFGKIISSLSSRVFLMHNVHDSHPVIYHTRWAMSYLRGPMTRPQLKELMKERKAALNSKSNKKDSVKVEPTVLDRGTTTEASNIVSPPPIPITPTQNSKPVNTSPPLTPKTNNRSTPPSLNHNIEQRFFAVWKSALEAKEELQNIEKLSLVYRPMVLAAAKVRFYDSKRGVDFVKPLSYVALPADEFGRTNWNQAKLVKNWERSVFGQPDHPSGIDVHYQNVPQSMNTTKEINAIKKEFSDWLYQEQAYINLEHPQFKLYKQSTESEESFRMRVQQKAREMRDKNMEDLEERFSKKFERLEERIEKSKDNLSEAEIDVKHRKRAELIGMAETVFSVFSRRRLRSVSAATTRTRMRQKAKDKLENTREDLMDLQEDYVELKEEMEMKLDDIRMKWDTISDEIVQKEIKPRRTDVMVNGIVLAWLPYWVSKSGQMVSARRE